MKKWFHAFMAILTLVGMAFPFTTPVMAQEEEEPDTWHSVSCIGGACPADAPTEITLEYSGSLAGGVSDLFTAKILCEGWGCTQTSPVYYEIIGHIAYDRWADQGAAMVGVGIYVNSNSPSHTMYCGTGMVFECTFMWTGTIPGSDINPNPAAGSHIGIAYEGAYATGDIRTLDLQITLATEPINTDCDDEYVDVEYITEEGAIDPTNETGEYEELVTGETYKLIINGGPWQASVGGGDRHDAAVKLGEDDWASIADLIFLDEYVQCVQNNPEDPNEQQIVFEAPDVDFWVRVNDLAGAFADNTGTLNYTLIGVEPTTGSAGCEDDFLLVGTAIGSGTIAATNSSGVIGWQKDEWGKPGVGQWVTIVVQGAWKNNGAGDNSQSTAIKYGSTGTWTILQGAQYTQCVYTGLDDEGILTTRYYIQIPSRLTPYLRVGDEDGQFGTNTGSLTYTVYMADYTPPQTGCGMEYAIGDYIESLPVPANLENGLIYDFEDAMLNESGTIDWPPNTGSGTGKIVAIVTSGTWLDDGEYSIDGDVSKWSGGGNGSFYDLASHPDVLCAETIDPIGHVRVYMQVYITTTQFSFRVQDGADDWTDNTGTLTYKFYAASETAEDGDPGDQCGYSMGQVVDQFVLNVKSGSGYKLDIDTGEYYAIVLDNGPWYDDGNDQYQVAISETKLVPATWSELSGWADCSEDIDEHYTRNFFYALPGYDYYVRANDQDLPVNFNNNTGSIRVTVYDVSDEIDYWDTCGDAYSLEEMTIADPSLMVVGGYQQAGTPILYISQGGTYALEILGTDAWTDPDETGNYEAQVCLNNNTGCLWIPIAEAEVEGLASCVVKTDLDKNLYRMYWTVNGDYKIRVYDTDDDWSDNSGRIKYKLYYAGYDDPDGPTEDEVPEMWENLCYNSCIRPSSVFRTLTISFGSLGSVGFPIPDVAGWASWSTCQIMQFFAWCPYHTEAITGGWLTIRDTVEPLATMYKLQDFVTYAQGLFSTIGASGGETTALTNVGTIGAQSAADVTMQEILMPGMDPDNNPWFGGNIQLALDPDQSQVEEEAFVLACRLRFYAVVGDGAADGICSLMRLIRFSPIFLALITAMDIAIIFFLIFRYAPGYVKRWFYLLSGRDFQAAKILGGKV